LGGEGREDVRWGKKKDALPDKKRQKVRKRTTESLFSVDKKKQKREKSRLEKTPHIPPEEEPPGKRLRLTRKREGGKKKKSLERTKRGKKKGREEKKKKLSNLGPGENHCLHEVKTAKGERSGVYVEKDEKEG